MEWELQPPSTTLLLCPSPLMACTLRWLTMATTRSGRLLLAGVQAVWQGSTQMLQTCFHAQPVLLASTLLLMVHQPALAALLASPLVPLVPQMPAPVSHACLASTSLPQPPPPAWTALHVMTSSLKWVLVHAIGIHHGGKGLDATMVPLSMEH